MSFAPFVGVNNQDYSILLGRGLILQENTEIYTWLFNTWLSLCPASLPLESSTKIK